MSSFKIDEDGNAALFAALAAGFHNYGLAMADMIADLAPAHTSRRKRAYRDTITASTYLNGTLVAGEDVKVGYYGGKSGTQLAFARSMRNRGASIETIVYTTSKLGHLLEFGTQPHLIPVSDYRPMHHGAGRDEKRKVRHPGATRRPHFTPGFLASRSIAGAKIAAGAGGAIGKGRLSVGGVRGRVVKR